MTVYGLGYLVNLLTTLTEVKMLEEASMTLQDLMVILDTNILKKMVGDKPMNIIITEIMHF